jgi:hypothetical protein
MLLEWLLESPQLQQQTQALGHQVRFTTRSKVSPTRHTQILAQVQPLLENFFNNGSGTYDCWACESGSEPCVSAGSNLMVLVSSAMQSLAHSHSHHGVPLSTLHFPQAIEEPVVAITIADALVKAQQQQVRAIESC